jgi:hypothetical protein
MLLILLNIILLLALLNRKKYIHASIFLFIIFIFLAQFELKSGIEINYPSLTKTSINTTKKYIQIGLCLFVLLSLRKKEK